MKNIGLYNPRKLAYTAVSRACGRLAQSVEQLTLNHSLTPKYQAHSASNFGKPSITGQYLSGFLSNLFGDVLA